MSHIYGICYLSLYYSLVDQYLPCKFKVHTTISSFSYANTIEQNTQIYAIV